MTNTAIQQLPSDWRFNQHAYNSMFGRLWIYEPMRVQYAKLENPIPYSLRTSAVKLKRTFISAGYEVPSWLAEIVK